VGRAPRADASSPPSGIERRSGIDRRDMEVAGDGGAVSYNRRRGPGRRLSDFTRAAEEGELNQEQFLFLMAIDEFKRANGLTFPAWTDVLEVFRLLGYRKTMPCEFRVSRAEDWTERADAPANVRPRKHSDVPDADHDRREAA
jgi:hypothetical protein